MASQQQGNLTRQAEQEVAVKWLADWYWRHALGPGALAFLAILALGVLTRDDWNSEAGHALIAVGEWGYGTVVIIALMIVIVGGAGPDEAAMIVSYFAAAAVLYLLPSLLIALVTSRHLSLGANSGLLNLVPLTAPAGTYLAPACLVTLPVTLLALPVHIAWHLPYSRATAQAQSLVPAWTATLAAAQTWLYVILLHFGAGKTGTTQLGPMTVAGLGVAIVLAPAYRYIAGAIWQRGMGTALNPAKWVASGRSVYREIIPSKPQPAPPATVPPNSVTSTAGPAHSGEHRPANQDHKPRQRRAK